MNTKIDVVLAMIKERFLLIKEGDICPVSASEEVFDVTVDTVTTSTSEYASALKNQRCALFIDYDEVAFGEMMPQKSIQCYNVLVEVAYRRKTPTQDDGEYEKYARHLPLWLNMMLADETTSINDLWGTLYHKPNSGRNFRNYWKIETFTRGQTFSAVFGLTGLTIRQDVKQLFA